MKKCLSLLLCLCLVAAVLVPCAGAAEEKSPLKVSYLLRIDGQSTATVKPGDIVTVTFSIKRSDGGSGDYFLRIVQNEIIFDKDFFEYVPGSAVALRGSGNALYQKHTDGTPIIKASYLSPNGGSFHEEEDFCTFQLRVVGTEGSGSVRCDWGNALAYDGDNLNVEIKDADNERSRDVSVAASGPCHPFTDVQKSAWYHEAVDYVWLRGLMNGMGNNLFEPNRPMTRAMVVTVLWRLQGSPETSPANTFSDVEPGQWYTDAVTWANEHKIVLGYGDGTFGPYDDVTREQIATILQRFSRFNGKDVSKTKALTAFTDAGSVSFWAKEAMEWAVATGLIVGRTETSLAPGHNATRAEVATLLMRYYKMIR